MISLTFLAELTLINDDLCLALASLETFFSDSTFMTIVCTSVNLQITVLEQHIIQNDRCWAGVTKEGLTYHIYYFSFPQCCVVYVGLAQAHPNYFK